MARGSPSWPPAGAMAPDPLSDEIRLAVRLHGWIARVQGGQRVGERDGPGRPVRVAAGDQERGAERRAAEVEVVSPSRAGHWPPNWSGWGPSSGPLSRRGSADY